jgi:hypothetical protein
VRVSGLQQVASGLLPSGEAGDERAVCQHGGGEAVITGHLDRVLRQPEERLRDVFLRQVEEGEPRGEQRAFGHRRAEPRQQHIAEGRLHHVLAELDVGDHRGQRS